MNKNSDHVQKSFPYGVAGEDSAHQLIFFQTYGIIRNESS